MNDQELREQCRKEAEAKYPAEGMPRFDGEVSYGPSWRQAYAEALFTERKSNRELVQMLVDALWHSPGISMAHEGVCSDPNCGCKESERQAHVQSILALAASKGITPTT